MKKKWEINEKEMRNKWEINEKKTELYGEVYYDNKYSNMKINFISYINLLLEI
jgi:hypothetical protein